MERIISYDELPRGNGQSIYFRMETDPRLYRKLLLNGYKIVNHIDDTDKSTIYVTGRRQDRECKNALEYKSKVEQRIQSILQSRQITKPKTISFTLKDFLNYQYRIPFVLKNEYENGGREKFLIATEEDYENLISAIDFLLNSSNQLIAIMNHNRWQGEIDYKKYLETRFVVQEYIKTPTEYNTTVRVLTSPSHEVLYASLKYNQPESYKDRTSLLGHLLSDVYPLSTKSIVSNTLSGGKNILLGETQYPQHEKELLERHHIESDQFHELIDTSETVHESLHPELGIICGFDYIYDEEKDKWYFLEYHSRPMVGDYSKRQGIPYQTIEEKLTAEGRVRATSLSRVLKRNR